MLNWVEHEKRFNLGPWKHNKIYLPFLLFYKNKAKNYVNCSTIKKKKKSKKKQQQTNKKENYH